MADTLSAILSKPAAPNRRAALFIGLAAETPHQQPARIGLAGIDRVSIGRGASRTIVRDDGELALALVDPRLSTQHARLTRLGEHWILEDLDSKNGTWIGGRTIDRHTLDDGDVIEVGHTMLVYRTVGGETDAEAEPTTTPGLATLSPALADHLARIVKVAPATVPVLIGGETGTGKELVARAVHAHSGRHGAFVAVNCGAIPESLVEAELFGHEKGAFTGAGNERLGLIRSADGGTLFLDEIAELPPSAQAALLRVLQEGEVTPIGADRPIRVVVRLVAATLRDLDEAVSRGAFRADLLGRLLGVSVALPPLRARREDLAVLFTILLARVAPGRALRVSPDAVRALYAYAWPRNVRELERALAAACALAGDRLELEHLPDLVRASAPPPRLASPRGELSDEDRALRDTLATALAQYGGNVAAVARDLGKDRTQIRRWMRRFGLARPGDDE
jgi:transcriptional regulator with GAF, ATPase, and Fis domain